MCVKCLQATFQRKGGGADKTIPSGQAPNFKTDPGCAPNMVLHGRATNAQAKHILKMEFAKSLNGGAGQCLRVAHASGLAWVHFENIVLSISLCCVKSSRMNAADHLVECDITSGAGRGDDIFFHHRAAKIIGTKCEGSLTQAGSLSYP